MPASEIVKDMDPDDPTKGTVTYRGSSKVKGIFSLAYYFRETDCVTCTDFKGQDSPWVKTDVYKTGILHYLRVTDKPEFEGWKVLIYIDQHSIDNPIFTSTSTENAARIEKHRTEWEEISNHPNVVFGIINWPEYAVGNKGDGKTIDNAIIRALRMKAFQDFPDIPVFVRDADTLFENLIKVGSIVDELAKWEKTLWDALKPIFDKGPYKILIASQPNYQRQWHVHPSTGVKTTGCYAAVTSCLGGVPEWSDGSLWRKCLQYFRANTQVVQNGAERRPNNIDKPTYIGKDEQLLSYVVIPNIFDKVYFYYLEYIQVEGGAVIDTPETPFAPKLIAEGITKYPSPYMASLGEPTDLPTPPNTKRKDANEVTERTLLNPLIIPMSLDPKLNHILKVMFQYFLDEIKAKQGAPGFVPMQAGAYQKGGRGKKKNRRTKRRKVHRNRTKAHKRR
jgi:hypothetical protein